MVRIECSDLTFEVIKHCCRFTSLYGADVGYASSAEYAGRIVRWLDGSPQSIEVSLPDDGTAEE